MDAFLGRAISAIVVDPKNSKHLLVGSAQAVRGLSHVIGAGGTTRVEPGANEPGLYESWDGGNTFTEVWDGTKPDPGPQSFGVTDVGLDPLNPGTVYVAAPSTRVSGDVTPARPATAFNQVFAPQFNQGAGIDRADVRSDGQEPAHADLPDRGHAERWPASPVRWRRTSGASTTPTSRRRRCLRPRRCPAFRRIRRRTRSRPTTTAGSCLTSKSTGNPYFATDDFCTGQCWYDQDVYTPDGMPDTVYVIGSYEYGELPCDTKGVGCGNGRSNGRGRALLGHRGRSGRRGGGCRQPAHLHRPDVRRTGQAGAVVRLCAVLRPGMQQRTERDPSRPARDRDQPRQSDPDLRGLGRRDDPDERDSSRTSRRSATTRSATAERRCRPRRAATPACKRLLSRVPVELSHIDKKLSSTLQFIGVSINPNKSCEVMAGTQDNGTWSNLNNCDRNTWPQIIYGDGGNAGYDATEPTWRFNEFTGGFSDSNFKNGDPERWVISSAPIVNSGESPAFYWPQVSDPNPVPGHAPDLLGREARLADLGLRSRSCRCRAAGHDSRHRLLRGELRGVRHLGRAGRLR